jgi:hypothetical protein
MSRRGHAADRRARAHVPIPAPDAPDCCTCGLRIDLKNQLHTDRPPAAVQAHTAVERARLAEHD